MMVALILSVPEYIPCLENNLDPLTFAMAIQSFYILTDNTVEAYSRYGRTGALLRLKTTVLSIYVLLIITRRL